MNPHVEIPQQTTPVLAYLKRYEMPALLQKLSKHPSVFLKIKRIDRLNFGNFTTVARATSAMTILRDVETGENDWLPDISIISEFQISSDFEQFKANTLYSLIP